MFKKILNLFLGRGIGGIFPFKQLSRLFIFLFNPFVIEDSKLYLPLDEIQFLTGYERDKVKLIKKITKKGDVILDVGAHIGYYTMLFAKIIGSEGKIFAFEPDKANFKILEKK